MHRILTVALSLMCLVSPGPERLAAQAGPERGGKIWIGRNKEFEDFIRTAPIVRAADVGIGVTKPRRAFFAPGGLCGSVAFKALRTSRDTGYLESYDSEIAAYEMDKLLGLDMVPPTVERTYEGKLGSAQLWVENNVYLESLKGQQPPDVEGWNRQIRRWRVFHSLIADIDPNQGNELVVRDPNWQLVLIDHSRAFTNTTKLVFDTTMIDRPFFERVKALDKATLEAKIGQLVLDGSKSILKRRDLIVARLEKLATSKGDAAVFTR